jgi:hypothetical protein
MRKTALTVLGLALAASSCSVESEGGSGQVDTEQRISQSDLGKRWPLTVDSGTLHCQGKEAVGVATFKDPQGKVWALNGFALQEGLPRINPIWHKDSTVSGLRMDIGPLIDRALRLCK